MEKLLPTSLVSSKLGSYIEKLEHRQLGPFKSTLWGLANMKSKARGFFSSYCCALCWGLFLNSKNPKYDNFLHKSLQIYTILNLVTTYSIVHTNTQFGAFPDTVLNISVTWIQITLRLHVCKIYVVTLLSCFHSLILCHLLLVYTYCINT